MKIVILGAGGMGSRFGLMLKKAGKDVTLLDGWDKNIEAIREHGIRANYNGEEVQVDIDIYPIDDFDPDLKADLLIVFTKAMQLEDAIQATRSIVTDQTKVLCLMNGIGYDDILRKYFDDEQIVLGNTMWTAGLEGPGRPKLFGNGYVNLLNLGKSEEAAAAAKDIVALLDEVGLNGVYEKEIFYLIYKKVCVNATMNGLCTILECNMADLGDAQASHDLINQLVKEVVDVANAEGVEMDLDEMIEHVGECFNRETIGG
ncbi:2-dehydropantoate 2-reductase, partial [Aerococcus urinae]|uniref:2-dehydropantoate 2-reductase n=2 Tax=Aerococcaceae TaxID=186827 RepID=UPI00254E9B22